jgi:hypothetical protein
MTSNISPRNAHRPKANAAISRISNLTGCPFQAIALGKRNAMRCPKNKQISPSEKVDYPKKVFSPPKIVMKLKMTVNPLFRYR